MTSKTPEWLPGDNRILTVEMSVYDMKLAKEAVGHYADRYPEREELQELFRMMRDAAEALAQGNVMSQEDYHRRIKEGSH